MQRFASADSDPSHSSGLQVVCLGSLLLAIVCWNIIRRKGWNKDVLLSVLALSWLHSSVIQFLVKVTQDGMSLFRSHFCTYLYFFLYFICRSAWVSLPSLCCLTFLSLAAHALSFSVISLLSLSLSWSSSLCGNIGENLCLLSWPAHRCLFWKHRLSSSTH